MSELFYDLHLHSCLSPCGDDDSTPGNIAGMCHLAGVQACALTDHNTTRNCRAFLRQAEEYGLLAVPGMELTTAEEVHVVCLFADIDRAEAFSDYVYDRLPDIPNRPARFGNQILCDEQDNSLGQEPRFLLSATDIGIYDVPMLVESYGGIAFPAHIDRSSFSLLSNLGLWDPDMGFSFAERTRAAEVDKLPKIPYLISSDAHRLENIPDAENLLKILTKTPAGLIDALRRLC